MAWTGAYSGKIAGKKIFSSLFNDPLSYYDHIASHIEFYSTS
jgi:hypothetical protein